MALRIPFAAAAAAGIGAALQRLRNRGRMAAIAGRPQVGRSLCGGREQSGGKNDRAERQTDHGRIVTRERRVVKRDRAR